MEFLGCLRWSWTSSLILHHSVYLRIFFLNSCIITQYSMVKMVERSSVCLPVRPSVCPIDREQQRRAAGLLLSAPRMGDIDWLLHGAPAAGAPCCGPCAAGVSAQQQRRRSTVLSSKYKQRYVHRRRRRLNADTDLFCLRGSGNQKALTANARLIKYFCALALITTLNSHQGAETIQTVWPCYPSWPSWRSQPCTASISQPT